MQYNFTNAMYCNKRINDLRHIELLTKQIPPQPIPTPKTHISKDYQPKPPPPPHTTNDQRPALVVWEYCNASTYCIAHFEIIAKSP